jgi:serine/threonine-protein kinase RsbT
MSNERRIYINNDLDIVTARMQAREMAKELGFGTADQARISLAASELARILTWSVRRSGEIIMSDTKQNGQFGVQIACLVHLNYADLASEHSPNGAEETSSVAGRSLAGACRLVDESIVEEQSDTQAQVILIKWLK